MPEPTAGGDGTPAAPRPSRTRAWALPSFFALVGFLPANWIVRIPDVKAHVGASAGDLGLALLCGSVGGLVATVLAGRTCIRFGTRRVMVTAAAALGAVLVVPTLAGSVEWLAPALVLLGVTQSMFNIALNSTAVEEAAARGNPLMPTLHGIFSVGGLVGAAVGGLAADYLTPAVHLGLVCGLGLLVVARFGPSVLRPTPAASTHPDDGATPSAERPAAGADRPQRDWRTTRWIVLLFGVVAACTAFAEFANNNWAALHLREDLGATAAVAAYGYACYAGAIAAGRFVGSRLIRRFGETVVLTGGFLLALVGILTTSWAGRLPGGLPLAFAAYVLLGLGLANVYPLAISRGGVLGGPRGVSRVSMVASLGVLSQAPVIGLLADRYGLPAALSTVALLATLGGALALGLRSWSTARAASSPRSVASVSSEGSSP